MNQPENVLAEKPLNYLPKSFKIGGYDMKVLQYDELYGDDGRNLYGQFDLDEQVIKIRIKINDKDITKVNIYNTFWHELFHVFNYLWNTETDESLASTFAMLMVEYNQTKEFNKNE